MNGVLSVWMWTGLIAASGTLQAGADPIEAELANSTVLEFQEAPLKDVAEYLTAMHGIAVTLDESALKEAGLSAETPVTISIQGISLQSALNLFTEQAGLSYRKINQAIVLGPEKPAGKEKADLGSKATARKAPAKEVESVLRLRRALKEKTQANLDAVPLEEALKTLGETHNIPIFLDRRGLKKQMTDPASPVTLREQGRKSLDEALKSLLGPLKLKAIVRDEVVFVTPAKAN